MIAFLILLLSLGRLYREMFKQAETRALLLLAALIISIGIIFYMRVEHWSFVNALYFCVVTLGTVGYGDLTPTTDFGKVFTTFYIIVGLSVIGGFLATMGRMIGQGRFMAREESLLDRESGRRGHASGQDNAEQRDASPG
jgi:hypothetical protein